MPVAGKYHQVLAKCIQVPFRTTDSQLKGHTYLKQKCSYLFSWLSNGNTKESKVCSIRTKKMQFTFTGFQIRFVYKSFGAGTDKTSRSVPTLSIVTKQRVQYTFINIWKINENKLLKEPIPCMQLLCSFSQVHKAMI